MARKIILSESYWSSIRSSLRNYKAGVTIKAISKNIEKMMMVEDKLKLLKYRHIVSNSRDGGTLQRKAKNNQSSLP